MSVSRRSFVLGALVTAVAGAGSAKADVPWHRYLAMREEASEVLDITVASVSEKACEDAHTGRHMTRIVAELKVDTVVRSASRLKDGRTIALKYNIVADGVTLVFPPRPLKAGERLRVYLMHRSDGYGLAAGKASFEDRRTA
jgi:hypothetical protein